MHRSRGWIVALATLASLALPRQVGAQVCPGTFIQCCDKKEQCTCSTAGGSCGIGSEGLSCGNGGTCSCTDVCDNTDYTETGCTNFGNLTCSKPNCASNQMVVTGSCNGSTGGGGGGGGGSSCPPECRQGASCGHFHKSLILLWL